jgi:hypothetical protein
MTVAKRRVNSSAAAPLADHHRLRPAARGRRLSWPHQLFRPARGTSATKDEPHAWGRSWARNQRKLCSAPPTPLSFGDNREPAARRFQWTGGAARCSAARVLPAHAVTGIQNIAWSARKMAVGPGSRRPGRYLERRPRAQQVAPGRIDRVVEAGITSYGPCVGRPAGGGGPPGHLRLDHGSRVRCARPADRRQSARIA